MCPPLWIEVYFVCSVSTALVELAQKQRECSRKYDYKESYMFTSLGAAG